MTRPTGEDEMSNETEWVLVKRDDLLRWAEDFARDNDPGDDTDIVTPFDDYLLQPPSAPVGVEGAKAYCKECNAAGMGNCAHFDECGGARCITCHQQLNQQPAAVDGVE